MSSGICLKTDFISAVLHYLSGVPCLKHRDASPHGHKAQTKASREVTASCCQEQIYSPRGPGRGGGGRIA